MSSKTPQIRIKALKRKNRRNNLIKDLEKYINISSVAFLELEDNECFCRKVFKILNQNKNKIRFGDENYQKNIKLSFEMLKNLTIINKIPTNKDVRLFFFREQEIEAIRISISDIFNNLEFILEKIGFLNGTADVIIVSDDLTLGICIERDEHWFEFSYWGVQCQFKSDYTLIVFEILKHNP